MTTTTNYLWDPDNDSLLLEMDENNNTTVLYNQEPTQYGGVISQHRGGETRYYHTDALGSTEFLTDENGDITDTYMNDAWGNEIAHTGMTENPFRWVGKVGYYWDEDLGRYYIRARNYEPVVGRWVSVDPMGFVDGIGLYVYAHDNPFLSIDPSGLACSPVRWPSLKTVNYVPGRGVFDISLADARTPNKFESNFGVLWKPKRDPNPFISGECCCCTSIEFIQIYRGYAETDNWAVNNQNRFGLLAYLTGYMIGDNRWHIDGPQLMYPYGTPGVPCKKYHNWADMHDTPGVTLSRTGIGLNSYKMLKYRVELETCAVCVSGIEGINWWDNGTPMNPSGTNTVGSIVTYGCVKWGHDYFLNKRWLESQVSIGGITLVNTSYEGMHPSRDWIDCVQKYNS